MKAFKNILLLFCLSITSFGVAQNKSDSLGLPGDNFDLYGALELFKKSENPEAFEKAINNDDNNVNNLDLNGDGEVDYVKVIDNKDGDAHTMVLQVAVSKNETQDVAVIEVEKTKDNNAHIQIVGDEELYGKDYIIEPKEEKTVSSEKIKSDSGNEDDVYKSKNDKTDYSNNDNNNSNTVYYNNDPTVYVNVYPWPMVQYIYTPAYVVYTSPWYYGYYPGWWSPWRPVYWRSHYWHAHHYHHHYWHANFYRSPNVHKGYYGRRMSSETVRGHQRSGFYAERQIAYKDNVKPGRKYNATPANPEKKVGTRQGYEGNKMNQPNGGKRNYNTPSEQNNTQPKGGTKNYNNAQSEQMNSQPKGGKRNYNSPSEQTTSQPKKSTPIKSEESQPVKQNKGGFSKQQNGGGGRSYSGSNTGVMKQGGGNNGGTRSGGGNGGGGLKRR